MRCICLYGLADLYKNQGQYLNAKFPHTNRNILGHKNLESKYETKGSVP